MKTINVVINGNNVNLNINGNVITAFALFSAGRDCETLALSGRPEEFSGEIVGETEEDINALFLELLEQHIIEWSNYSSMDGFTRNWVKKLKRIQDNGGKLEIVQLREGTDEQYPDLENIIWGDNVDYPREVVAMESMANLEMFSFEHREESEASPMTPEEENNLFQEVADHIDEYIEETVWNETDEEIEEIELKLEYRNGYISYSHGRGCPEIWYRKTKKEEWIHWNNLSEALKENLVHWTLGIESWEA